MTLHCVCAATTPRIISLIYWGTTKRVQRRQKWTTAWAAWNGLVFGRFVANFTFQTLDGVSFLFEKGA